MSWTFKFKNEKSLQIIFPLKTDGWVKFEQDSVLDNLYLFGIWFFLFYSCSKEIKYYRFYLWTV